VHPFERPYPLCPDIKQFLVKFLAADPLELSFQPGLVIAHLLTKPALFLQHAVKSKRIPSKIQNALYCVRANVVPVNPESKKPANSGLFSG
jgi:hypothetical protein